MFERYYHSLTQYKCDACRQTESTVESCLSNSILPTILTFISLTVAELSHHGRHHRQGSCTTCTSARANLHRYPCHLHTTFPHRLKAINIINIKTPANPALHITAAMIGLIILTHYCTCMTATETCCFRALQPEETPQS
jgi:hypothetical protein